MFMANIMDFWRNEWKSVGDYSAENSSDSLLSFDYNNSKTAASCKIMKKVFIIIFIVCSTFVRGQNPFDSCFCMESMSDDDVAGVMDLMTRSGFTYITRGGNTQNCYRIKDCCNNKTVLTCMAFVFPDAGKALKAKALFEKKGNKHGKPELLELVLNHNHIVVETMQNVLSFNILYGNQYDDVWRQVRDEKLLQYQSDGKNVDNQFFSKKCCDTLSNVSSNAQSSDLRDFEGRYWLAVAVQLPLDLTFQRSGDSVVPVIYSVFQGNAAIKPTSWSFSGDTLNFRCKDISLKITAVYNRASNSFEGTFKQFVTAEKITFSPAEGPFKVNRPQTPQPPYSFDEEEVTITTADGSVRLAGTITYPKQGDKFSAVVLVSGSGQQNRDEEIFMHKPFLVVAEYFARRGIAVLRYDDRGVGRSTGDAAKATTLDFADDAEAAFTFLRKHKRIDSKRVGIVGHSEGALIAQIVAARCRKVSFVAFLGGQGCSGAEVLLQQNRSLFALQGVADSLIDLRLACMREFFKVADTISPKTKIIPVLQKVIDSIGGGVPQKQLQEVGLDKKSLLTWSSQLQMPWFKTFLKLTPADYIPRMRCPILALGGEKDVQVLATENLGKIEELSGGKAQVREMPGLNHLFQHCHTGSPDEYLTIEETISTEVLEILANWILQR